VARSPETAFHRYLFVDVVDEETSLLTIPLWSGLNASSNLGHSYRDSCVWPEHYTMYIEELNEETNLTEWRGLDESILATTGNFITEHTPELGIFTVFQDTRIVDLKETWITMAGDYNIRIDAENSRTRYKGSVDTFYYTFSLHCRVMSVD